MSEEGKDITVLFQERLSSVKDAVLKKGKSSSLEKN